MKTGAYYNEWDPFAAAWLGELMKDGLIQDGEIDTRSILDVRAGDLRGFRQCHFFAGIGGWPNAFALAGISHDEEAWSGSCPCQPLSSAGKLQGHADERHLWPAFFDLISECRPAKIFGEQVAGPLGNEWLAGIRTDLEDIGYAVGAANLPACGVGAPHIRYRNFWVAHTDGGKPRHGDLQSSWQHGQQPQDGSSPDRLGDTEGTGLAQRERNTGDAGEDRSASSRERSEQAGRLGQTVAILCSDGKWRRVPANETGEPEPLLFPLASRVRNRVGMLRGAGNAIHPELAARFIAAANEAIG